MTNQEIKSRRDEIGLKRRQLQDELCALDAEEGKNKFGEQYPIGAIVEDDSGKKFVVCGYEPMWVLGRAIRKDGTPASPIRKIWGPR
jgi:hypothetical protein